MIANLEPYPTMKDSDVPWLGEVPEHWNTLPLKRWVRMNEQVLPESTDPDYDFEYLDIGSVGTGFLTQKPVRLRFGSAPSRARRVVHYGDTLVSTVRTYLKANYFADGDANGLVCSTGFAVLSPQGSTVPKFVSYLARSSYFADRMTADSVGIAYPAIAESRLGSLHVPVPPPREQAAIVRFLDYVDRRIRRYVHAKQKLIRLLEEQKLAITHHAVTRGLDPNVHLKPSGLEWLGMVPVHWEVLKLARVIADGPRNGTSPPVAEADGVESFSISAIRNGLVDVRVQDQKYVVGDRDALASTFSLCRGDVLLVRGNGNLSLVGRAGLVQDDMPGRIYPDLLMRMRVTRRCLPSFLVAALSSTAARAQVEAAARTAVGTFKINNQQVRQISLAFPPVDEQEEIMAWLESRTKPLNDARRRAEAAIALIDELRSRLISDVVSGKVDVRGIAARLHVAPSGMNLRDSGTVDGVVDNSVDQGVET